MESKQKSIVVDIEGMNLSEAKSYAKERGYEIRVEKRNAISNFLTADYKDHRINVKVKNNNVESATIG